MDFDRKRSISIFATRGEKHLENLEQLWGQIFFLKPQRIYFVGEKKISPGCGADVHFAYVMGGLGKTTSRFVADVHFASSYLVWVRKNTLWVWC